MNLQIFRLPALLLLAWIASFDLYATDNKAEYTKKLSREFATTSDGTVALYNKYGKVEVKTWSENKVKIDVSIIVVANNQSDANQMFERINVNFMSTYGYVKAETMIASQASKWSFSWDGLWGNTSCAQDYKINYEVYMPPANNLDLKNSYGNSYLAAFNGKLNAEIKYGDIKSTDMSNDVDLNLAYGNGYFNAMRDIRVDLSYGKLMLEYAKSIQADTKYSEVTATKSGDIRLVSMYDDFKFGDIGMLKIQTKYSDVKLDKANSVFVTGQYTDMRIGQLSASIDADMNYGDLVINNLLNGFDNVQFAGNYADLKLVGSGVGYSFDLQGNYSELTYPRSANISTKDHGTTTEKVRGTVSGSGNGKIKARVNYGDIVLQN